MLYASFYTENIEMDTVHRGGKTFIVLNMNRIQTGM